jgi:DNA-binding transcriptional LysR family regulator
MDLRSLRYFVTVAEERHFGRAAARLHMTQPPLSRAIQQLEAEMAVALFDRTSTGASLTEAGTILFEEARNLLDHADRIPARVATAAGVPTLTVGVLAQHPDEIRTKLANEFRAHHPGVLVVMSESNLSDPTCGLRSQLVDIALTRKPFDQRGINTRILRRETVGVVLRADDALADRRSVRLAELTDRRWFRFPEGTDPLWSAYWSGGATASERPQDGPVVRTVLECVEAVLWNDAVGLAPGPATMPDGLVVVPVVDFPPSVVVVAWRIGTRNPLVASFARIATTLFRNSAEGHLEIASQPGPRRSRSDRLTR